MSSLPCAVLRKQDFFYAVRISSMGIGPSGVCTSSLLRGGGFARDLIWVHSLTFKV